MRKILVAIILLLSIFLIIQNSIGNSFSLFQQFKYTIPIKVKTWFKDYIFVHKSYKLLKEENVRLKDGVEKIEFDTNIQRKKVFSLSNNDEFFKKSIIKAEKKIHLNYKNIRTDIINDYILPKNLTTLINNGREIPKGYWINKPSGDYTVYKLVYYNMSHYGILEKKKGNKKLIVYNQGHDNNPYNHQYFIDLKNFYKNNGYDILSLSMTNLGYNLNTSNKKEKINFPGLTEPIIHLSHHDYEKFYDPNLPNVNGLALMLSGNYYLIKEMTNNYEDIVMVGISGGGWYTVLLSSIITEISKSYSFSGTFPFLLRMFGEFGDWEQIDSKIYEKYNYLDFYFLNVIDNEGNFSRYHSEIYNRRNKVFNDPAASLFKKFKNEVSYNKNLNIHLLDSDKHKIDIEYLKILLK